MLVTSGFEVSSFAVFLASGGGAPGCKIIHYKHRIKGEFQCLHNFGDENETTNHFLGRRKLLRFGRLEADAKSEY